jgi:hypothetical protein
MRRYDSSIPVLRINPRGIFVSLFRGRGISRSIRTPRINKRFSRVSSRVRTNRSGRTGRSGRTTPTGRGRATSRGGRARITRRTGRITRNPRRARTNRTSRSRITRSTRTGRGRTGRTTKRPPVILRIPKNFKSQRLSSSVNTYYVVEKIRGKFRKLYPKPLTMKDARDYATYSIDNRLSKTAFFIPLGKSKRVVRPSKNISGYFSRNSQKFRPYRIKYGKRKQLVNGYIEKRRYFNDTIGERIPLRNLRNKNIRNRVKRRISPQRRRQLIKQLEKARRMRR